MLSLKNLAHTPGLPITTVSRALGGYEVVAGVTRIGGADPRSLQEIYPVQQIGRGSVAAPP